MEHHINSLSTVVRHSWDVYLPFPPYIRYTRECFSVCVWGVPISNLIWFKAYPDSSSFAFDGPYRQMTFRRQSLPSRFQFFIDPLSYSLSLCALDCWQRRRSTRRSKIARGLYRGMKNAYREHGRERVPHVWLVLPPNEISRRLETETVLVLGYSLDEPHNGARKTVLRVLLMYWILLKGCPVGCEV